MLEAIKYENGRLTILNQLLLPEKSQFEDVLSVEDGWNAIRQMKVRGAPAIAIVGSLSLAVELIKTNFKTLSELTNFINEKLDYLISARPTAVNMKQSADRIKSLVKILTGETVSVGELKIKIIEEAVAIMKEDVKTNEAIGDYGASHIIKNQDNEGPHVVLTHCNTGSLATAGYGTALGVIRSLRKKGKLNHVYCTETRPYNQGSRLTAFELLHDELPFHLICDDMVAALMQTKKVTAVVVGADRVAANGDTANKIGTYQIAVVAKYHNVPFYIASPLSTIDLETKSGKDIPIEERSEREMTHIKDIRITPEGVKCWNPAFDITPASLITGGIITEKGVFKPSQLSSAFA